MDVIDSCSSLDGYKLIIAPMLYMFHNGIQDKIRKYVRSGGYILTTAFSGYVNESDLCFRGEASEEKLSDVFGFYVEEIDALYDSESNRTIFSGKEYRLNTLCEIIQCTGAKPLCTYIKDFYNGLPVITENNYGSGKAYHISAYGEQSLYNELLTVILGEAHIPDGIGIVSRSDAYKTIVFIGNFAEEPRKINIKNDQDGYNKSNFHYFDGKPLEKQYL